MNIDDLIHILQGSIAPCILISGVGLLHLAMTNRLGRASDRIRALCREIDTAPQKEIENIKQQIAIFYRRCKYLQTAIFLAATSIFCISLVVLMLFFTFIFNWSIIPTIKLFFGLSLMCLVASLACFLFDIRATLNSLKLEIEKYDIEGVNRK